MISQFNKDLTSDSAREFGLEWAEDKLKEEISAEENKFYGVPKNLNDLCVGIYQKVYLPFVDMTLNPANAYERKLMWTSDGIMDPEAPAEANKEFLELEKEGYKFGEPANVNAIENNFVGIYKPIK